MTAVPLLHVALDHTSLPPALAMALRVADEVDITEIGTPLCKAEGLEAIQAVRQVCPDKLILADFKSLDVFFLTRRVFPACPLDGPSNCHGPRAVRFSNWATTLTSTLASPRKTRFAVQSSASALALTVMGKAW